MKITRFLTVISLASFGMIVFAANPDPECEALAQKITKQTGVKVDSVRRMPMAGLFEVLANKKIVYMDRSGTYAFIGHIYDTSTDTDLTAKRIEELNRVDWKTLPLKDALKVVYGNGKRKVVVFTDARCTYCSLLEKNLEQVGNVTVYNFIHPVLNSRDITRSILCSKDPVKAWRDHMTKNIDPAPFVGKCDTSVLDRNLQLGKRFSITGTPVLIFEDGSVQPGALPVDELERRLNHKR